MPSTRPPGVVGGKPFAEGELAVEPQPVTSSVGPSSSARPASTVTSGARLEAARLNWRLVRRIQVLVVITAILAGIALNAAPGALADGDPASDVLVQNRLFNPIDSGVSPASQARLDAVLGASARAGFPIRVALIASPTDLGSATSLWRDPKDYARYLWIELSQLYGGQVLVVMPSGFGLYGQRSGPHAVTAAELGVRATAPGPGPQLATAAGSAIPLLARAAGDPIPASALAAADRAATPENARVATDFTPSIAIALIVGALLIAASWGLSVRRRPLQIRRRAVS